MFVKRQKIPRKLNKFFMQKKYIDFINCAMFWVKIFWSIFKQFVYYIIQYITVRLQLLAHNIIIFLIIYR